MGVGEPDYSATHLAGDPGSDVVETLAPRKLLANVEEGKHLEGKFIHIHLCLEMLLLK